MKWKYEGDYMTKMTKRECEVEIKRLKNSVEFFKEMWIKERAKDIIRRYSTPAEGSLNPTTESYLPTKGGWRSLTKKRSVQLRQRTNRIRN